eukprot:SAG11_NODE_2614_length_3170_cov_2.584500_5_plen_161_part_00
MREMHTNHLQIVYSSMPIVCLDAVLDVWLQARITVQNRTAAQQKGTRRGRTHRRLTLRSGLASCRSTTVRSERTSVLAKQAVPFVRAMPCPCASTAVRKLLIPVSGIWTVLGAQLTKREARVVFATVNIFDDLYVDEDTGQAGAFSFIWHVCLLAIRGAI